MAVWSNMVYLPRFKSEPFARAVARQINADCYATQENHLSLVNILKFEDLVKLGLSDTKGKILSAERKRAGDLTLRELCTLHAHPNGVYVFFGSQSGGDDCQYVGKASSRSFAGRLPCHFEPLEDYWMNYFSKRTASAESVSYESGVRKALDAFVVLIGFGLEPEEDNSLRKSRIVSLELVLRRLLQPSFNKLPCPYTGSELLLNLTSGAA